ncbi:hypothetical protein CPB84DRAFT_1777609 [Gymnopilus junonius]|uniref:Uncharacterized protein n=1 Tax=Gymnopilus junonius TaxID=109634 RepID=A0A9P5NNL4_GYMJU|nr:hypothetical protein CPB84DRAFT_1777609 [Gymnopilus junonius]
MMMLMLRNDMASGLVGYYWVLGLAEGYVGQAENFVNGDFLSLEWTWREVTNSQLGKGLVKRGGVWFVVTEDLERWNGHVG